MKSQGENKILERLNRAVASDGRSARQVAIAAGMSASRLSLYMLGKAVPPIEAVSQLAGALGVPAPWLAGMSDEIVDGIRLDEEELRMIRQHRATRRPGQASAQVSAHIAA